MYLYGGGASQVFHTYNASVTLDRLLTKLVRAPSTPAPHPLHTCSTPRAGVPYVQRVGHAGPAVDGARGWRGRGAQRGRQEGRLRRGQQGGAAVVCLYVWGSVWSLDLNFGLGSDLVGLPGAFEFWRFDAGLIPGWGRGLTTRRCVELTRILMVCVSVSVQHGPRHRWQAPLPLPLQPSAGRHPLPCGTHLPCETHTLHTHASCMGQCGCWPQ